MPRLLVRNFSISLDGYAAGPYQDLGNRSGLGAVSSTNGCSPPAAGARGSALKAGKKGSTTSSSRTGDLGWVPRSWVGTCSAQYVALGARTNGLVGGEKIRPFITRYLCSLTTRGLLSKCKEGQRSISSTAGPKQLSTQLSRQRVTVMSWLEAAQAPLGSTFVPP